MAGVGRRSTRSLPPSRCFIRSSRVSSMIQGRFRYRLMIRSAAEGEAPWPSAAPCRYGIDLPGEPSSQIGSVPGLGGVLMREGLITGLAASLHHRNKRSAAAMGSAEPQLAGGRGQGAHVRARGVCCHIPHTLQYFPAHSRCSPESAFAHRLSCRPSPRMYGGRKGPSVAA